MRVSASTATKKKTVPVADRRPSFEPLPEEKYQHDNEVLTLQVSYVSQVLTLLVR